MNCVISNILQHTYYIR